MEPRAEIGGDSDINYPLSTPIEFLDISINYITDKPSLPLKGILSKVTNNAWSSWEGDYNNPDPQARLPTVELMPYAIVRVQDKGLNFVFW